MLGTVYGEPCVERHTAYIYDRGGKRRLWTLKELSKVEWGRIMDGISTATITLSGKSCDAQAATIRLIEPRRHELVIYRGNERVWEGPIMQRSATSTFAQIVALDVLKYFDGTALTKDWPTPPTTDSLMVDRIHQIISYELTTDYTMMTADGPVLVKRWENVDPPANILPYLEVRSGTTQTWSATTAFQMTVGDHLANLWQSVGVSMTTVGRKIVVWDGELSSTRTVTEKDFAGDFTVLADGSAYHTITHAIGQSQTQGQPVQVGHAANDQSYYGPWEEIVTINNGSSSSDSHLDSDSDSSLSSAAVVAQELTALNTQARRDLYGIYPVPTVLQMPQNSTMVLSKGLGINDLVAGINMPTRAQHNITPVAQLQRLIQLDVVEDPTGEAITPTMDAIGELTL